MKRPAKNLIGLSSDMISELGNLEALPIIKKVLRGLIVISH